MQKRNVEATLAKLEQEILTDSEPIAVMVLELRK